MNEIMNLFLENNEAMEKIKGSWGMYSVQKKCSALICTLKNKRINVERVNEALELINSKTSFFSIFRGNSKYNTAVTISLEENMNESLDIIISIYEKLKKNFSGSNYLAVAAQVIYNARYEINIDDAVKNTKEAYDYMKKNHRFLTSYEDISAAAIIGTTAYNLESTFVDVEQCYEYLKSNKISTINNIQSLANLLSIIEMPSMEKCNEVIEMSAVLKVNKVPLRDFYTPMLGVVPFLTDNKEAFAKKVVELSSELKGHKGFGNWSLGAQLRNMIAVVLVGAESLGEENTKFKENLISNTNNIALTVVAAIETAVVISSAAAASAAASSSSS